MRGLFIAVFCLVGCGDDSMPLIDGGSSDTSSDVSLDTGSDASAPDAATPDANTPDAVTDDANADTSVPDTSVPDAGPPPLVEFDGCFTVEAPDDTMRFNFGEVGTEYPMIVIELEAVHGGYREELYDRDILNHNLFGLSRVAPTSVGRYILGLGAQIRASSPGLRRRAIFYGRVDLEMRPMGMGFMGYTSFRDDVPWTIGARYQVRVELDAAAQEQRLEVREEGEPFTTIVGAIDYYDASLSTSGWVLELGSPESEHRDVSPVGWQLCNVRVYEP